MITVEVVDDVAGSLGRFDFVALPRVGDEILPPGEDLGGIKVGYVRHRPSPAGAGGAWVEVGGEEI
jgi:hypothetical protein